jgi:hypothetical protein
MSLTSQVGTAAGVLAAAGAGVSLWLGAERYAGPPRRAYRWFAVAAALWGAGVITSHVLAVPVEAAAIPLSFGDLPSLLALPAMAAGFARLAAAGSQEAAEANPPAGVRAQSNALTRLADGYILASALFLIAWVTLFRMVFLRAGAGVPAFAGELIHPLADLILLGACLPLAAAAGRRGAIPYLAVLTITVGDALAVGARAVGLPPQVGGLLVQAAGLALLAWAPWRRRWAGREAAAGRSAGQAGTRWRDGWPWVPTMRHRCPAITAVPGVATAAAATAAAAAALIIIGWALAGERGPAGGRRGRGHHLAGPDAARARAAPAGELRGLDLARVPAAVPRAGRPDHRCRAPV